jgi:hypothetical protein
MSGGRSTSCRTPRKGAKQAQKQPLVAANISADLKMLSKRPFENADGLDGPSPEGLDFGVLINEPAVVD